MFWHRAGDGDKNARSPGRAWNKSFKPLRRECRIVWLTCGDYACVLFSFAHKAAGAVAHPAFPAPSAFAGDMKYAQPGQDMPRERGGVSDESLSSRTSEARSGSIATDVGCRWA